MHLGQGNEVTLFQRQDFASHDACKSGPKQHTDGDDKGAQSLSHGHRQQQREQDRWESDRRIDEAHEHAVHAATYISGYDAN